jgi:putative IMPACT (imprinted ancient) family translation regulator
VVVTRYFGGVLLGTGGLVRAYTTSCKQGIDTGKKVKRAEGCLFELECDYEKYGKLNNYFQKKNVILKGNEFLENITMKILCFTKDFESINSDIKEMMNGNDIIKNTVKLSCFIGDSEELMEV